MKKLLTAIRVLQLIAFMIFLEINYTPIVKYVIQKIYEFVTFKVVPPEAMEWITTTIGLRKSKSAEESPTSRRL